MSSSCYSPQFDSQKPRWLADLAFFKWCEASVSSRSKTQKYHRREQHYRLSEAYEEKRYVDSAKEAGKQSGSSCVLLSRAKVRSPVAFDAIINHGAEFPQINLRCRASYLLYCCIMHVTARKRRDEGEDIALTSQTTPTRSGCTFSSSLLHYSRDLRRQCYYNPSLANHQLE